MEHTALPMRIEEYAARKGLKTRHQVCPFCGSKTAFSISKEKQVFNCLATSCPSNAGGKSGGNVLTLCALLEGCDTREAYRRLSEMAGNPYTPAVYEMERVESNAQIAPLEVRHKTYSALLKVLALDDKHKTDLRARGFEKDPGYGTMDLSPDDRERVCRILLRDGCTLQGVPGFYVNARNNWTIAYAKRSMMVPSRDSYGMIQGIQLRKDKAVMKEGENKYIWFSSSYLPKGSKEGTGTGARTFVHYASFDSGSRSGDVHHFFQNGICLLTEGAMKADLAHEISGQGFIAVPGVNALTRLEAEFARLKELGVTAIVNAYDMDYLSNRNVQEAVEKTKNAIQAAGFEYSRLVWDDKYKGIDDYFAYKVRGIEA